MTRRDNMPQITLLAGLSLILLALPFVTTYNDLLTTWAIRLGVAQPLQSVSPVEARMVVALLQLIGIHAAAAGSHVGSVCRNDGVGNGSHGGCGE